MRRPRLTIAAEVAALGALLVGIAALVVVIFFDTGIRMPWDDGGTPPQPGRSISVDSDTASPPSTVPRPQSTGHTTATQPTPADDQAVSTGRDTGNTTPQGGFWTTWYGLCLGALLAYGVLVISAATVSFIAFDVFDALTPSVVGIGTCAPVVSGIYLWLFWQSLPNSGIVVFLACTALVTLLLWVFLLLLFD